MSQNQTPSTFAAPDAGQGNAYAVPAAAGSGAVDLGAVLSGMWQRKLLMLSIFAVIVLGVTAFVFTATPKYTAVAKVLIEGPSSPYRAPDLGPNQRNADERVGEREVYSQAEVIESRDLAARVAKKLNLSSLAEFSRSAGSSPISSLLSAAGLSAGSRSGGSEQRATTKLMKNLSVYPVNRSSVIKVEYESESPETAAAVVNALTDAYLGTMRDLRRDDTAGAVGWLNEQIAELEGKVRDIENKVEQHRASAGLVRGQAQNSTLIQEELTELNRQLALAAAARAEADAKSKSIRKMLQETGSVAASNDVINSNLIQRLREQEIALGRRLAELRSTYLSSHPRIVSARQEVGNVRKEIRNEAMKIVKGLEQQASIASAREASLRASIGELKAQASTKSLDEVELRRLERDAKASSEQLERLQKRRSDAESRLDSAAQLPGARVIEAASVPSKPSFPKKGPTLLVAIGGAAAIALLIAFLLEAINPRHRAAVMAVAQPSPRGTAVAATQGQTLDLGAAASAHEGRVAAEPSLPPLNGVSPQPPHPLVLGGQSNQQPDMGRSLEPSAPGASSLEPSLPLGGSNPPYQATPPAQDPRPSTLAPTQVLSNEPQVLGTFAEMPGDLATSVYAVVGAPESPYAESVKQTARSVATRLNNLSNIGLYVAPSADPIQSTAVATGLARAFAGFGLKTLVVDASLSDREFLTAFGIGAGFGLTEFLNGNVGFADAIVSDGASSAHVMTMGVAGHDVVAGADRERVATMLHALRQAYDVVIVSGANLAQHGWAANFADACDLTLYVAPEVSGQGAAMAECQVLGSVTTSDLAIILTGGSAAAATRYAA